MHQLLKKQLISHIPHVNVQQFIVTICIQLAYERLEDFDYGIAQDVGDVEYRDKVFEEDGNKYLG